MAAFIAASDRVRVLKVSRVRASFVSRVAGVERTSKPARSGNCLQFVTRSSRNASLNQSLLALRTHRTLKLLSCFAVLWLHASSVHANGAFPAVSQLLADPADSAHLVLRSNFGLLLSHDHAQTWDWVCEAGVGYQNVEPAIAVLDDGTTIAALPNGVAHGATECAFELSSGVTGYVADVARVPGAAEGVGAVAVSVDIDGGISRVFRSVDSGRSFAPYGRALNGRRTDLGTIGRAGSEQAERAVHRRNRRARSRYLVRAPERHTGEATGDTRRRTALARRARLHGAARWLRAVARWPLRACQRTQRRRLAREYFGPRVRTRVVRQAALFE